MKLSFVLPKPMSKLLSKPHQDEQTASTKIDCGMGFWNVADGISAKKNAALRLQIAAGQAHQVVAHGCCPLRRHINNME